MNESINKQLSEHLHYLKSQGVEFLDTRKRGETASDGVDPLSQMTTLSELKDFIGDCRNCPLWEKRNHLVYGEGNPNPELVLVGEGPGYDEDRTGFPFVGRAGQLLDRIIAAMGLTRKDIYICNIVKCRPPGNRDPEPNEIECCGKYLNRQLELLKPRMILALGRISGHYLTGQHNATIRSMRGTTFQYHGIDLRVTYHPAALLRNTQYKRPLWEDVQAVMALLGKPVKS